MMSRSASWAAVLSSTVFLGACQTTDTTTWIPASNTPHETAATDTSEPRSSLPISRGLDQVEFEIADPYAYDSIPPGVRPAIETAEAGLWHIMDRVEAKSKVAGNRLRDEALTDYIDEIVCTLSGPYCPDVRPYIMRVPSFNATMAPNGMMSIWSGLLLRVQNEAQLATILGHEIGHYVRRHSIQRFEDMSSKADFLTFFSLAAATLGVPLVGDVAQLAIVGSISSYSRDNEREADLIGINLMARSGYDTREASVVWLQLIEETDPDGDKTNTASFTSSHPAPKERSETLAVMAQKLQGDGKWGVKNEERFDRIVGPWKFSFLQDEVRRREWDETLRLLALLEEHGHSASEVEYFRGEVFRNRDRDGDDKRADSENQRPHVDRALEHFEKSAALPAPPADVFRSLGMTYMRMDRSADARKAFETFLKLSPNSSDAEIIRHTIEQLESPQS